MSNWEKTALVTGGAGFLGSHLCESLLKSEYSVIAIDDFSTGRYSNIRHLTKNPNFRVEKHDVTKPYFYDVHEIWNLACPASPPAYQADKIKTINTNFMGVTHALELARQIGAKVFQASTSEVYGDPIVHPQHEEYWGNANTVGPRSCYDEGKRIAETLMTDYHHQYGIQTKIARIFNTYGPNLNPTDGRVVSNFIYQAINNQPISIYGDGTQTRSFCYVSDLIGGFRKLMDADAQLITPVNLGNPTEFTMLELAQLVIKKTESKSEIQFHDLPINDPKQRKPDITKAKFLLQWEPQIDIQTGIDLTIKHFREQV